MKGNDWTLVKPRRFVIEKGGSNRTNESKSFQGIQITGEHNIKKAVDVVSDCVKSSIALKESNFFKELINEIHTISINRCFSIISLGIGQICSSPSSLLQLAMVVCIKMELNAVETNRTVIVDESNRNLGACNTRESDELNVSEIIRKVIVENKCSDETDTQEAMSTFSCNTEVQIFDPLFTSKEHEVCRLLDLTVSNENLKGKHSTENTSNPTLFFMPHCPYRLYVNVLWKNWENLEKVFILGNRYEYFRNEA